MNQATFLVPTIEDRQLILGAIQVSRGQSPSDRGVDTICSCDCDCNGDCLCACDCDCRACITDCGDYIIN